MSRTERIKGYATPNSGPDDWKGAGRDQANHRPVERTRGREFEMPAQGRRWPADGIAAAPEYQPEREGA